MDTLGFMVASPAGRPARATLERAVKYAYLARACQERFRAQLEDLVVGNRVTLQEAARDLGITADAVDDLLYRIPPTVPDTLGISKEDVSRIVLELRTAGQMGFGD